MVWRIPPEILRTHGGGPGLVTLRIAASSSEPLCPLVHPKFSVEPRRNGPSVLQRRSDRRLGSIWSSRRPASPEARFADFAWMGRNAEAHAAVAELLKLMRNYTVDRWAHRAFGQSCVPQQRARVVEGLRKAKLLSSKGRGVVVVGSPMPGSGDVRELTGSAGSPCGAGPLSGVNPPRPLWSARRP